VRFGRDMSTCLIDCTCPIVSSKVECCGGRDRTLKSRSDTETDASMHVLRVRCKHAYFGLDYGHARTFGILRPRAPAHPCLCPSVCVHACGIELSVQHVHTST
jgi:hypothetical protein